MTLRTELEDLMGSSHLTPKDDLRIEHELLRIEQEGNSNPYWMLNPGRPTKPLTVMEYGITRYSSSSIEQSNPTRTRSTHSPLSQT